MRRPEVKVSGCFLIKKIFQFQTEIISKLSINQINAIIGFFGEL